MPWRPMCRIEVALHRVAVAAAEPRPCGGRIRSPRGSESIGQIDSDEIGNEVTIVDSSQRNTSMETPAFCAAILSADSISFGEVDR
jgi:hypothetical protein